MRASRFVSTRRKLILKACALTGLLAGSYSCGDEKVEPSRWQYPDSLLGSWVRVYPAPAGKDTVVVKPDGVASGSLTAVDAAPTQLESGPIVQWEISRIDPRALCFGDGRNGWCSGYQLRGDTLALANGANTVFLRAGSTGLQSLAGDSGAEIGRARWGDVPSVLPIGRGN